MPARDQTGWCWSAGARMTEMTILIPVAMVVIAIGNWRSGLGMLIATALLEGPLRKLAPDQPVHFVLLPAVVFGAMILSAMVSGVSIRTGTIAGWSRHVALPFAVYAGWILLQALNALSTTGSLVVPSMAFWFISGRSRPSRSRIRLRCAWGFSVSRSSCGVMVSGPG